MKRMVLLGVAAGLAIAASGAVAWANGNGVGASNPQNAPVGRAMTAAASALDSTTELKYTSIAPCRAVAGPWVAAGQVATFSLAGCAVPSQAVSVTATITMLSSSGSGWLKAWAPGQAEPATSFLNVTKLFNVAVGGEIPTTGGKINVKMFGAKSRVLVDVTGYYLKPMTALVGADASLVRGSRVLATAKISTGGYEVTFDRDVSLCSYAATPYFAGSSYVEPRAGKSNAVFVGTVNSAGTATNNPFYLVVTC